MSITKFFKDTLKAPVKNHVWSWGSVDHSHKRVFLRIWENEINDENKTIIAYNTEDDKSSPGQPERLHHISLLEKGYSIYAVVCRPKFSNDGSKCKISSFDKNDLLEISSPKLQQGTITHLTIVGKVSIEKIIDVTQPCASELRILDDIKNLDNFNLNITTKTALIQARLGQGQFCKSVLEDWNNQCAVTGSRILEAIRASHIKPWVHSNNEERLSKENGLPLLASIDALFDGGLITFTEKGKIQYSRAFPESERRNFGMLNSLLREPSAEQKLFLKYHYNAIFIN